MMSNRMGRKKNGTRYLLQIDLCQYFPKINHNAVIKSLFRQAMKLSLTQFSDQELKDELKRREKERRSQFPPNLRCRDCKHCMEGLTFKYQVIPTTVCRMKPKPSQGPDRYYSTVCSLRACDKFEIK